MIRSILRFAPAAVIAAGFTLAWAVPASASVPHATGLPVVASTSVTTPDNGHGTPSAWANDSFTEATEVVSLGAVAASFCAPDPGTCYAYSAPFGVSDKGGFATIRGAGAPNQAPGYTGETVNGYASGTLTGDVTYSEFYSVETPSAANVPATLNGVSDTGTYPALLFADPSMVHGLAITAYDFRYAVTSAAGHGQKWADTSGNGDGNVYGDGQITG